MQPAPDVGEPRLVIFDCDGVLVDSEPLVQRVEMGMVAALGWPITLEEIHAEHLGRSWPVIQANIERHIGRPLPDDFHARRIAANDTIFREELQPVDGVLPAYEALLVAGYRTCVASSGAHDRIRLVLGITGLLPYVEGRIFSAEDVTHGKPAPDLFLYAARQMDVDPCHCVVVEDSPAGVAAARAAGMRVVGYGARAPSGSLAGADVLIDDMQALPDAVQELLPTE